MNIYPVADYLFLQQVAERQSTSGIILPEGAGDKHWRVAIAGPDAQISVGCAVVPCLKKSAKVEVLGTHYVVTRAEDLFAVLN